MTEHVCSICKERFDVTIGRARAFTCIPCQDRIDKALRAAGYTKESAKTQRLAVIDRVREEGWAVLDTLSKRASTTTRVPKVEKPIAAGDVLAQYLARITAWREAEATAKVEKARIAKEAERACLNEDKKVDAAKGKGVEQVGILVVGTLPQLHHAGVDEDEFLGSLPIVPILVDVEQAVVAGVGGDVREEDHSKQPHRYFLFWWCGPGLIRVKPDFFRHVGLQVPLAARGGGRVAAGHPVPFLAAEVGLLAPVVEHGRRGEEVPAIPTRLGHWLALHFKNCSTRYFENAGGMASTKCLLPHGIQSIPIATGHSFAISDAFSPSSADVVR